MPSVAATSATSSRAASSRCSRSAALVTNPLLLILDEATEGLAPLVREEIWRALATLRSAGLAMIVIDKYVERLVAIGDHHVIVEKGRIVWRGSSRALGADRELWHRHLGA